MVKLGKLALPVILAIEIIGFLQAASVDRYVKLYDANGKELELGKIVAEQTTVGQLKRILGHLLHSKERDIILFTPNRFQMDDYHKFLIEYFRPDDDVIIKVMDYFNNPQKIQVKVPERIIDVNLSRDGTLASLIGSVCSQISSVNYRIVLNGRKLTNNSMTLGDYNFYHEADVIMAPEEELYSMVVRTQDGEFLEFDLTLDTTVAELTKFIESRGFIIKDKSLIHYDTIMANEAKVFSYSKVPRQGLVVDVAETNTSKQATMKEENLILYEPVIRDDAKLSSYSETAGQEQSVDTTSKRSSNLELIYESSGGNQKYLVDLTITTTVGHLRQLATGFRHNSKPSQMALIFQGRLLEDDLCKLADLDLKENSRIRVSARL